jgi:DNA-binding response OmpR family regulator
VNVLSIEDDRRIAAVLTEALKEEGHHVTQVDNGLEGEEHILSGRYEVVLLDLMIPGLDGLEVLRRVRKARSRTPILVLSARDSMADVVRALDLGADDYLTKPFHLEMLLARVRSVSRRGTIAEAPLLEAGDLTLDRARREVRVSGQVLDLTKLEYTLLETLMRRAGRPVTREQLIEAGWGLGSDVSQNSLEFQIHSLRGKLDGPMHPSGRNRIRTVRGVGYQIE